MKSNELSRVLADHAEWNNDQAKGKRANLRCADLNGANLRGANLRDANLRGADLSSANISYANLHGADLRDADLHGANLHGADLCGADLRGANLRCLGNMFQIKTLQIDRWNVGYTYDTLQIGCQRHAIEKWMKWDTVAGHKWIARMDDNSLEWANKFLPVILNLITVSPADKP